MHHVDGAQKQVFFPRLTRRIWYPGTWEVFSFFYDVLDNAIVFVEEVLLYVLIWHLFFVRNT